MYLYSLCLWHASFLMVNSSWTQNHIDFIITYSDWFINSALLMNPFYLLRFLMRKASPPKATIVYPPCDTRTIARFPLDARENVVLSIAQFRCVVSRLTSFPVSNRLLPNRPEKDHPTQLYAFAELLRLHPEYQQGPSYLKLVLIGGSRSSDDEERVEALQALSKRLEIDVSLIDRLHRPLINCNVSHKLNSL
jgi:alpha-1,2-mannosyltransferase